MKKVKAFFLIALISTNMILMASCTGPVNVPKEEVKKEDTTSNEKIINKVNEIVDSEKIKEKLNEIKEEANKSYENIKENANNYDLDELNKKIDEIKKSVNDMKSSINKDEIKNNSDEMNERLSYLYTQLKDVEFDKEKINKITDDIKSFLGLE